MGIRGIAGLALSGFLVLVNLEVARASPEEAAAFIEVLGTEAISTLGDPALSEERRIEEFRRLLYQGFDIRTIGRFALGRYWRRTTQDQRSEYEALFGEFLVSTYASRLNRYFGETLYVQGARGDGEDDAIVMSEIRHADWPPLKVNWRVRRSSSDYKIIDVIIEGLSMAITQRDEFASVIQRSAAPSKACSSSCARRSGQPNKHEKRPLTLRDQAPSMGNRTPKTFMHR